MATDPVPLGDGMLREALTFMESALQLLDRAGAPAHIGAHLDLAICELQSAMPTSYPPPSPATGELN
jgi:hypothetical protein